MKKELTQNKTSVKNKKQTIISTASVQNILSNLQFPNNKELKLLFKILNNSLQENERLLKDRNFLNNKIIQEYNLLNKYNEEVNVINENIFKVKKEIENKYNYQEKLKEINVSFDSLINKLRKLNLNDIFNKRKKIGFITKEKKIAENKNDLKEITSEFRENKNQFIDEFEKFHQRIKIFPIIKVDFDGFEKYINRFNFLTTEAKKLKLKINDDNLILADCDQKINKLRKKIEQEVEEWLNQIKREMIIEISGDLNSDFKTKIRDLKISQL
ncbi:hypothetical protein X271_00003 [Candidatus Hepatoplasma crinochetorum Av]|uniref:Uncharacterized protein n=1 Tax=Candidatus Hepatoplasma crinochetorum Av TaxID=1427984 RepID=W8GM84_9MOLU|nr:hypothetical protein [Candidatus Hepatoplasma crinochetorum]AHK22126.1 hypothetical protein X271_00003 [Candidatus Hepatoplasma crinochetorum Av]